MPHKVRNVFGYVHNIENLNNAYYKASYCKRERYDFLLFDKNYWQNIASLQYDIEHGTYHVGKYDEFDIYDKKHRHIMKLPPRDRVAQHAWNNIVCPIFDSRFIYDSYACRIGKGTQAARDRVRNWLHSEIVCKGHGLYVLKLDIHHYFESINHQVLMNEICKVIDDKKLLDLTWCFIESNGTLPEGIGLPIGNLSSQLFANIYGNILDKFCKHDLHCTLYIRYMDDILIFGNNYQELDQLKHILEDFINSKMLMQLNPKSTILYCDYNNPIEFIGFRYWPDHCKPRKDMIENLYGFAYAYAEGYITTEELCKSFPSMIGFSAGSDNYVLKQNLRHIIREALYESYLTHGNDYDIDFIMKDLLGGYYNEIWCKNE